MTPVEFCGDLWHQKTRVPGLSCGVVYVILSFAVLVEHRLVTDTDTDRHRRLRSIKGAEWGGVCGGVSAPQPTRVQNSKSLALAVVEIFQGL